MSEQILTPSQAWLNAKDNWLGQDADRPADRVPQSPDHESAQPPARQPAPQPYAEIYFAHG